jgi:hypothetical protein
LLSEKVRHLNHLKWAFGTIKFLPFMDSFLMVLLPGTDVMIFKIFSPKILAKKLAFFAQTTDSFCKNCGH